MYLTLRQWADVCGGEILAGDPASMVGGDNPGGLAIDSRKLEPGQWFIALKGRDGQDGHYYLQSALDSGAGGLIVFDLSAYESMVKPENPHLPALLVPNSTQALGQAARKILDIRNPFVVTITGTVGKTSVKEAVAHIASVRWPVLKNPHNWNTEIGLPLTVFDITPDHRVAVLECASRGIGQIRELSLIARADLGVITAIGPGHLSEFGSLDAVARGKWEIVDGLKPGGKVIAAGDSPYTKEYGSVHTVITFGTDKSNDVHLDNAKYGQFDTSCEIVTPAGNFSTTVRGTGSADVLNALCATACCLQIEVGDPGETLTLEEISEALKSVPAISGRSEIVARPSGIEVIFDAYNSNPMSLENALGMFARREQLSDGSPVGRRVAILGDMLELGDEEEKYHHEAGSRIAELSIDVLITIGSLAYLIRESAEKTLGKAIPGRHFDTTDNCAIDLPTLLQKNDLVLMKASRTIALENLLDGDW